MKFELSQVIVFVQKTQRNSTMWQKIRNIVTSLGMVLAGVFIGQIALVEQRVIPTEPVRAEVAIVLLNSIEGDQLNLEIMGPARILWAEEKLAENDGHHQIPLGQIPDSYDLKFKQFAYTANAKTGKFYPSTSYPARGTAVRDRRFFQTKQAAIGAGFIPTKLVK